MFVAIAPIAGCGAVLAKYPGSVAKLVVAVLVFVLATAVQERGLLRQFLRDGRLIGDRNQDWRSAVSLIREKTTATDSPVFVRSGWLEADRLRTHPGVLFRDYCLAPVKGIYRLDSEPRELIPLPKTAAGQLDDPSVSTLRRHGGGWFLINGNTKTRRQVISDVMASLSRSDLKAQIESSREFGDVLVFQVVVERQ